MELVDSGIDECMRAGVHIKLVFLKVGMITLLDRIDGRLKCDPGRSDLQEGSIRHMGNILGCYESRTWDFTLGPNEDLLEKLGIEK